jgi:hypothetical protein
MGRREKRRHAEFQRTKADVNMETSDQMLELVKE